MSRVMLVCPEPLGHGQPAGIGIRFLEIANALLADRQEVVILSPDADLSVGCESVPLSPASLRDVSARADVAVVQGHVINDFVAHAAPIATVIDLYDPFIVENLHYYEERGGEVFTSDHGALMRSIARGDLFLCASEAQRLFYLGVLLAAGRLNPIAFAADPHLDSLLRVAPFGVQPRRGREVPDLARPAILFGGIYDWYDPIAAIDAVALVRRSIPGATLTFTRHPNPALTPQGRAAEAAEYVRKKGYEPFVRFEPWIAYERRGELFDRHALAVLTFPQSIETDLSMRTRVYDYLWGGLPVVTTSAPGTDEILERYHAGAVVREDSAPSIAAAILSILQEPSRYHEMTKGAAAFVDEHQWSRTLAPLVEFCRAPRVDPAKETFLSTLTPPEQRRSILKRLKRRIGGLA